MLLSLLPLAGWAADPVALPADLAVTFTPATYNGTDITPSIATATATVGETANTDVSGKVVYDKTFSDLACTNEVTPKNAGTYYVRVKGDGTNYLASSVKVFTFVVDKFGDITVFANPLAKVYGEAYPTTGYFTATMPTGAPDATAAAAGLEVTADFSEWDVKKSVGVHEFEIETNTVTNYNVVIVSNKANLTINKANLTVKAENKEYEYGATPAYTVTYGSNIVEGDADIFNGELTWTVKNASNKTFEETKGAVGEYTITPGGLTSDNYNFDFQTGTLTVTQRAIAKLTFTFADDLVYDGTDQAAKVKAIKTVTDANGYAVDKADFEVTLYDAATGGSTVAAPTNAGDYYASIAAKASTNYTGTTAARQKVTIAKKQLNIITNDASKEYDGTTYTPTITDITFGDGDLAAGDKKTDGTPKDETYLTGASLSYSLSTAGAKNAGTYTIMVSGNKAPNAMFKNYLPNYVNVGELTIKKVKVKIQPNDVNIQYGATEPNWAEATAADFTFSYFESDGTTTVNPGSFATAETVTDVFSTLPHINRVLGGKTAGSVGAYDLLAEGQEFKNNYELLEAVKGTLTIEAATSITVKADDVEITFGDYADAAAMIAANKLTYRVSGATAADKDKITATLSVVKAGDPETAWNGAAGTYTIKVSNITIDPSIAANYAGVPTTPINATLTVNKKALKIEALAQSLAEGDEILPASAETVKINTEGVSDDDIADLFDATNGITLAFDTHVSTTGTPATIATDAATSGWTGTATATNGIYVGGITINATAYNAATDVNYTLTGAGAEVKAGKLTVTAPTAAAILDNTATATTQITNQVDKKQAITISTTANKRKLYANQWNALVLPFDITPYEFTQAIGTYAVFDLLEAGGDALNFKISIGTIPAYTPFLVKVDKEIDLSTKPFTGVTVKAIDEAALTQSLSTEANYKFVGTVKKDNYGAPSWTIQPNSTDGSIKLVARKTAWEYKAFTAYLTTIDGTNPVTAPVIYVEEPDGVVTAIKSINADGVAVPADGWYTLGGVKLQAAPTEKGVYIYNGKKFVIK